MPARVIRNLDVPDILHMPANRLGHVIFHALHVVDVVLQLHEIRVEATYQRQRLCAVAQQVLRRLEEVERLDHQDDAGSLRQRQRPFKVFDDHVELRLTRECACVVADQAVHAQARHPLCERDRFSELLAPLLAPGRVVREAARALADVAGVRVVQGDAQAQLLDRAGDLSCSGRRARL